MIPIVGLRVYEEEKWRLERAQVCKGIVHERMRISWRIGVRDKKHDLVFYFSSVWLESLLPFFIFEYGIPRINADWLRN